jgi:threonyl-tRNA synthetase
MPVITLPDGSKREFDNAVTVMEVAQSIGSGLAKATLAGRVNDELVDASTLIENDATLQIITAKDAEGLEVIRHSAAHLLAQAVKRVFPEAQVTIGPVIDNGFYYDFAYERAFTPDDIKKIEKEMSRLVAANLKITRSVVSRDEAIKFFRDLGEEYKAEIIESIPADQDLSLYRIITII